MDLRPATGGGTAMIVGMCEADRDPLGSSILVREVTIGASRGRTCLTGSEGDGESMHDQCMIHRA
jgi:hypothetical protein